MEKIPDEALVLRGGANRPIDIQRGTATHPSGVTGVSVQSAAEVSIAELAATIPHGQVLRLSERFGKQVVKSFALQEEVHIMQR